MNKYKQGYNQAIEDVTMFLLGYFSLYITDKIIPKKEIDRLLDKLRTLTP